MNRLKLIATMAVAVGLAGQAWAAGDAAAGKAASTSCALCHGQNGEGTEKGAKIAGMDPAKFTAGMNDYRAGNGKSAMMKKLCAQLSDQDIANLAAYYTSLK